MGHEAYDFARTTLGSFLIGIVSASILTVTCARFFEILRERGYKRQKQSRALLKPVAHDDDASLLQSTEFRALSAMSNLLRIQHEKAKKLQDRYHTHLSRVASAIFLAFGLMSFHLVGWHSNQVLELAQVWIEAIFLVFIFLLYRRARSVRAEWLIARSATELMRQFNYLAFVMPRLLVERPGDNFTEQYEREYQRIASLFKSADTIAKTKSVIKGVWNERKARIIAKATSEPIDISAIDYYVRLRPAVQMSWFSTSLHRIEQGSQFREKRLIGLFWTSVVLSFSKVGLAVLTAWAASGHDHETALTHNLERISHFLTPSLLIVAGVSATLTAYAMGNNSRSLLHVYRSQIGAISEWLDEYRRKVITDSAHLSEDKAVDLTNHILNFEQMMISELIDWLHITENDALELAP